MLVLEIPLIFFNDNFQWTSRDRKYNLFSTKVLLKLHFYILRIFPFFLNAPGNLYLNDLSSLIKIVINKKTKM